MIVFKAPAPDLAVPARDNDRVFPFLETLMIVDGRSGLRGHGGTMPVWGDTFEAQAAEQAGIYGGDVLACRRLLSLVDCLVTVPPD